MNYSTSSYQYKPSSASRRKHQVDRVIQERARLIGQRERDEQLRQSPFSK